MGYTLVDMLITAALCVAADRLFRQSGRFIPEKTDKSGAVQKCRSAFLLGLFVNFPNFTGKKEENFYGNGSEPARSFRSILASAVMLNVDSGKTPTERNCER